MSSGDRQRALRQVHRWLKVLATWILVGWAVVGVSEGVRDSSVRSAASGLGALFTAVMLGRWRPGADAD